MTIACGFHPCDVRILCGLGVVATFACASPTPERRDSFPPDITLEGVTLREYQGSAPRVVATMSHVELFRACGTPGDIRALDASVDLPAQGAHIEAPVVTGNALSARLEGSGGVVFRGRDGTSGSSPSATYDRALGAGGQVSSDAGVQLQHPQLSLEAAGVVLDLADERAVFDHAVTRTK